VARAVEEAGTHDLLRQVGRTVTGTPEPEGQIEILVDSIAERLKLNKDVLLDLCCGNGLVMAQLSALCGVIVGVERAHPNRQAHEFSGQYYVY
jgi:hypothetical protein